MECQPFKCRFCLTNEGQSVNLFDHYVSDTKICLGLVASQLFDLKISKEDGISGEICVQCFLKTYDYYYFKLKCQKSEHTLKESHSKRKKEVILYTTPTSTLGLQEIPQQDSNFKEKLEYSSRKRKMDVSREETNVLAKKLNSLDESLCNTSHTTSLKRSVECKSCLQCFPSPELIHHVLQHIKLEKSAEIKAKRSPEDNVCKDIDWTFEKVKATLGKSRCDPDLLSVKTEVPEFGSVHPPLSIKRESEPLEADFNDCAIVFVRELTGDREKRVKKEKDVREESSVERDSLLCRVNNEGRKETDEYSSQSGKSLLREILSNVSSSCDKMEAHSMNGEVRMENERVTMDSLAEIWHNATEETSNANSHQLKVVDVESLWLNETDAKRNLSKCTSRRDHNQNSLSKCKPVCISESSNAFENVESETILDKRTCNASVIEKETFQPIATMKQSCKIADVAIENEIECLSDYQNRVYGTDCIKRGICPNFISSNGKPERCDLARNQLQHSNKCNRKEDTFSGCESPSDSLLNKLHNNSEVNDIKERTPQQTFNAEGKSGTLVNNTTHNCGPDSPFSFICALCQDSFSSHSHLLKHLLVHKKFGTLRTAISFNIKQKSCSDPKDQGKQLSQSGKSADTSKVSADDGKKEQLHRTGMLGVNDRCGFRSGRMAESRKKTQISASSVLSHLKTIVCGSQKDNPSKSLLTEWTDSPKKLSLESNPLMSKCDPSQSNPSVCRKNDSNVKKFDCWLCVQTFPTARLLLDHSYVHFDYSETNMIYSSSHSDVVVNSSSNGNRKNLHHLSKSTCSGYSPITTSKSPLEFRFNSITLANGIPDRQLIEGEKLLQKKLRIDNLKGESGKVKSFRCPACLKKFPEWSVIVQHIVKFHENLSEDWPMKILFLPLLKQSKNLERNPLKIAKKCVKNEENPLHIMRSLLCGLRCEFCYKPFHSEKALLKHKVWAHPDNIGV